MKSKFLLWIFITTSVIVLAVVGLHLYLLVSKQGMQIHIGNFNIIRLGSAQSFFPAQFEKSFVPFDTHASNIRAPRFERNVTYVSEKSGDIIGKDIDTRQEGKFYWNEETHYICLTPDDYKVPGLDKAVDPVTGLKNYVFLNTSNRIGGISAYDVGLFMFRRDIDVGTPIRLILENETLDDGGLYIIVAIVFTKHTTCAKPADTISDFPTDVPTL